MTVTPPAVLIADDDPVVRLLVATALGKAGYRVSEADDGETALELLFAGTSVALLVTDIHMKRMNGDELLRRLRGDERFARLPVLVLTGSAEVGCEAELIAAGATDCIRKPVNPGTLVARVRAALLDASVAATG